MPALRQAFCLRNFFLRHRLLPQHELARLRRHARGQIQFAHQDFGFGRDGVSPSHMFQNGNLFLNFLQRRADILRWNFLNHFSPFRQNNSRSSAGGAAMTVPSGVSFGALTLSLRCTKPSLNAASAILPVESSNTSRLKTGTQFSSSKSFAFHASDAPARHRPVTHRQRLRMAAIAPIGDQIADGAVFAPGFGGGAQIGQRIVMPANQRLPRRSAGADVKWDL